MSCGQNRTTGKLHSVFEETPTELRTRCASDILSAYFGNRGKLEDNAEFSAILSEISSYFQIPQKDVEAWLSFKLDVITAEPRKRRRTNLMVS